MDELKEQIPPERGESPPCGMIGDIFSIFHEGERETENIKDHKVFNLDYIPEKIILREQARKIAENMGSYIAKKLAEHILISGLRGTGKTLTVKYLLNEAKRFAESKGIDFQPFYISVKRNRSTYSILREITGLKKGLSPEDLYKEAEKKINERRTIIALDEADFLKDYDILYFLTRETDSMIITIVTNPFWINELDDHVRSSFQPTFVHFPEYNPDELFAILKQRADMGLNEYDERGINFLAVKVASELKGDARYGILALRILGKWNKWDEKSVEEAIIKSVKDLELMLIDSLNERSLFILDLVSSHPDGMETSELYKEFKKEFDLSKFTFFSYLDELDKIGLISTVGRKQLKHGGHPYIVRSLIHYPDLIKEALKRKASF